MGNVVPLDIAGGSYRARSAAADAQTCVNLYAEADDTARSKFVLYGVPGLVEFSTPGAGPCRGMHVMSGQLYVISGSELYLISSTGTESLLGSVGGTGIVSMSDNGTQLFMTNGSQGWIYATGTGLALISDVDYITTYTNDFVDGYFVAASVNSQVWGVSAINDGMSWNAIDVASAESQPDGIVAIKVFRGEVWALGERTTEVWYNAANPTGNPFSRQNGATMQRGCGARNSVAIDKDAIYWLGDDKLVYRATGYQATPISTHAVAYDIAQQADFADAVGWTYWDQGHNFYCLTMPTGKTWVYDSATGLWSQRQSHDVTYWRARFTVECYGYKLVGDVDGNQIGKMSADTFTEYGDFLRWERTCRILAANNSGIFLDRVEIVMESGTGSMTTNPVVWLECSTDGARTWGFPQESNYGLSGNYRYRTFWNALGWGENFTLKFWSTDPYRRVIVDASMQLETGEQ